MANSFFRFKQFEIHQEACAMKVSTDACVLGAWAELDGASRLLDIGAGTGLLSLMAAQRNPNASVTAVEVDEAAYAQARDNCARSPFKGRIRAECASIQSFDPLEYFDGIITNPPFYQADLRSPHAAKNRAHHASDLTLAELASHVDRLLRPEGCLNILLPVRESAYFRTQVLGAAWSRTRQLYLAHSPRKEPFRELSTYCRNSSSGDVASEQMLYIYEADGTTHTAAFRQLLADFYLAF